MQIHTKLYLDYFEIQYDKITGFYDPIECTIQYDNCTQMGFEIHHIDYKRMGGSKEAEKVENYIASCRNCHDDAHDEKISKERLYGLQLAKMIRFKTAKIKAITDKVTSLILEIFKSIGIIYPATFTKFYQIQTKQNNFIIWDFNTNEVTAMIGDPIFSKFTGFNATIVKKYLGHNKYLICSPEELKDLLEYLQLKIKK